ncbi:DUF5753 domain-containing protein [Streptomyces niveiscabiei]|uniref:DUF5753 domain-containing protein n=1 Tax=Streptomyces niveiscabiei TaxID=164115 RepID=UPI0038F73474
MPAGGRPTVRSRWLGARLRELRQRLRLDLADAADAVGCSTAKISRIESGQSTARVGDVRMMLDLYEVRDEAKRKYFERLARESGKRGWWLDYPIQGNLADLVEVESFATFIRTYQTAHVPGLLQTPAYTRALVEAGPGVLTEDQVETIIKVRQERRRVIEETAGAMFAAVIWEPALTTPMRSHETHREQLEHILKVASQRNTTIQVLPQSEWGAARVSGSFVAFAFSSDEPSVQAVAIDTLTSTLMIEEADGLTLYAHAFDALRSAALTPDKTVSFIRDAINNIPKGE